MKTAFAIFIFLVLVLGFGYFLNGTPAVAPTKSDTDTDLSPGAFLYTYVNASGDMILVDAPQPNAIVENTFVVSGKARGAWYFEASFPIEVRNQSGAVITQSHAEAQGEWMTNEFVPFTADVIDTGNYSGPATLVLKKDNPSGDPERDASVSFPIVIQ